MFVSFRKSKLQSKNTSLNTEAERKQQINTLLHSLQANHRVYKIQTHERFKRMLFYKDKTQHFCGNPLYKATKQHLNNS